MLPAVSAISCKFQAIGESLLFSIFIVGNNYNSILISFAERRVPHSGVSLDNNAGAVLSNNAFFRNGLSSIQHSSTITNAGLRENIGGAPRVNDGQLDNIDTIKNSDSGTITNTGTLTNYYHLTNIVSAVLHNNKTRVNNGTLDSNSSAAYPPRGTALGHGLINDQNGVLTNNTGALLSNSGTLTNLGTIQDSGVFKFSSGGSVTGSGTFTQYASTTQIDGTLQQATVTVVGGPSTSPGR